MTTKTFNPPPNELRERWIKESETKPTAGTAYNYLIFKSSEWGFNQALEPSPDSPKAKALRALRRIEDLGVVSVWIGKDAIEQIKTAINLLPDN